MADDHSVMAESEVPTASARRYLGQLCKHFAHKIPATYSENFDTGRIEFSAGACDLSAASPDLLVMRCTAANADDLARVEDVVVRHLERFAFRETLAVTWHGVGVSTQGNAA